MIHVALARLFRNLVKTKRRRISFVCLALLVGILAVSTVGFRYFESDQNLSWFDSLWLSYVTMTTVGYGDLYPSSTEGRILGLVVTMTGGIGVVAYVVGLLATTFIEWDNKRVKGINKVAAVDHFLIINCPNEDKVERIINEIRLDNVMKDVPIVLIDQDLDECPQQFLEIDRFDFVKGNPLLRRVLERANAAQAGRAIILAKDTKDPNSDGVTTQIALTLENIHEEANRNIYTVAEAVSKDSIAPLKTAGVEDVICLETIISPFLVQAMLDPGVSRVTSELSSNSVGSQYYVGDVSHLKGAPYGAIRRLFQDREDLRLIPVALLRNEVPVVNPDGGTEIEQGDRLLYIGDRREGLGASLVMIDGKLTWKGA